MPGSQRVEFVADPDGYHKYTAHVLAMLSGYVYKFKHKAELLEKAREMHAHFDTVTTFGPNGNEAAVLENRHCVVVVWRGSATKRDWQDNLTLGFTPCEVNGVHGSVATGFWNHTDSEWRAGAADGVSAKLEELTARSNRKVFFTGHSLGGACAIVSACRFIQEQNGLSKVAQIVTTGQPRTVDGNIAKFLDAHLRNRFFRFVMCGDSIPQLLAARLRHAGVLKFITWEPAIYTDPPRAITAVHTTVALPGIAAPVVATAFPPLAPFAIGYAASCTVVDALDHHKGLYYGERVLLPEKKTLWSRLLN